MEMKAWNGMEYEEKEELTKESCLKYSERILEVRAELYRTSVCWISIAIFTFLAHVPNSSEFQLDRKHLIILFHFTLSRVHIPILDKCIVTLLILNQRYEPKVHKTHLPGLNLNHEL